MDRWSVFEHCCHPPLPKHRSLEMAGWTRSWVQGQANRDSTTPRSCQKHTTSEQLSSVAPFPVLSMLWTQGMVRRTRAMQHPTRVGCQLAPPLAISKLISNVYRNPIGPKSSTAKRECQSAPFLEKVPQAVPLLANLLLKGNVLDLTLRKLAQSLLLLKRASGDFADPQKALRLKRWTGKKAIKMLHQSQVWVCPECQTKFEGRYGSVISPPP